MGVTIPRGVFVIIVGMVKPNSCIVREKEIEKE